jgi:hypothetical protein
MDRRPAYLDSTYRDLFEILSSKHRKPFRLDCTVKARPPCLCGKPMKGSAARVFRAWSKLKAIEQMGVKITHAATRMRLASNKADNKNLVQQAFPSLSTTKLIPPLSSMEMSEIRTYTMAKQVMDMRQKFLDGYNSNLDAVVQQVRDGDNLARKKKYLQLYDSLHQSIEMQTLLERDIDRHNQEYGALLSRFRGVYTTEKQAVGIVSAEFHAYCQTDFKKYQDLETDEKNLKNFAFSFVRNGNFTENILGAYKHLANSPAADPAWVTMMRQQTQEPSGIYVRRRAMKTFAQKIVTARQKAKLEIGE